MDSILRALQSGLSDQGAQGRQYEPDAMGDEEIQEITEKLRPELAMGEWAACAPARATADVVREVRPNDKSRMNREIHVRFCESLKGWSLWATRSQAEQPACFAGSVIRQDQAYRTPGDACSGAR